MNLSAYQIAAEVLDRMGNPRGNHFSVIIRQGAIRRITRWIWKRFSMTFFTVTVMPTAERIRSSAQKMTLGLYDVTLDSMELISEEEITPTINRNKLYAFQSGADQRRMV